MIIVATGKMGHGTFEAKFIPLSRIEQIERIFMVRKEEGPKIDKIEYIVLPGICRYPLMNGLIATFVLLKTSLRVKADFILAYHYKPHFFIAYFATVLSGIPYILGQTGTMVEKYSEKRILGKLLIHVINKAYGFNVPGSRSRNFWISKGINPSKVHLLHSTINTNHFIPTNSVRRYDFIFIGRLALEKRLDRLVMATSILAKSIPNVKVCIVGDGPMKSSLCELVASYKLENSIEFVGFQNDTYQWLIQAKCFIMTSESEGLPCALMEAMSCGLPCIVPDINNMRDIVIPGETGFLFDRSNTTELYKLMLYVTNEYDELGQIQSNARRIIEEKHSHPYAISLWKKLLLK